LSERWKHGKSRHKLSFRAFTLILFMMRELFASNPSFPAKGKPFWNHCTCGNGFPIALQCNKMPWSISLWLTIGKDAILAGPILLENICMTFIQYKNMFLWTNYLPNKLGSIIFTLEAFPVPLLVEAVIQNEYSLESFSRRISIENWSSFSSWVDVTGGINCFSLASESSDFQWIVYFITFPLGKSGGSQLTNTEVPLKDIILMSAGSLGTAEVLIFCVKACSFFGESRKKLSNEISTYHLPL